jgi:hypothetical protein
LQFVCASLTASRRTPGDGLLMLSVTPRTRAQLNVTGTIETRERLRIYEIIGMLGTLRMVGMHEIQGITGTCEMAKKCEIRGNEEVMTETRGTEAIMTEKEGLTALRGKGTELGMSGRGGLTVIVIATATVTVTVTVTEEDRTM